ncbi:MAG TPA: alkaline phosphatase family protein [Terriglobales bacterium]|nr:alkaline phosphatase family protein [Terriglobales bacterium]
MKLLSLALLCLTFVLTGCRGITGGQAESPAKARQLRSNINHIVFMMQENRSFNHYFGKLGEYRERNGFGPASEIDGLPAGATNVSTDGTPIPSFHLETTCVEQLSPDWLESHVAVNRNQPGSSDMPMDGFVINSAKYSQATDHTDKAGARAMGYYDETDLPYYYFMAAQFATSDRWFSPVMSTSIPNRIFLQAGTTAGYVHEPIADQGQCCDQIKTIWHLLSDAGIPWKIYYTDTQPSGLPLTDINNYWPKFAAAHTANIVPLSEYFSDLKNGTLPAVAFIQTGLGSGRDEHPGGQQTPGEGGNDIQLGARFTSEIINAFMFSTAWNDSVFIFTFDESGAFYDHVPPQPAVHPDGIEPKDLLAKDAVIQPQGDFNKTGFRMPLMVISPFAKKNYVSHTVADFTAILKLIQTRFGLPNLSRRDAAQITMTEFFDFDTVPWATAPIPPDQPIDGRCDPSNVPQFGVSVPSTTLAE